jgi:ketosteroid isomerase-like protein
MTDSGNVRQEIDRTNRQFEEAFNRGDVAGAAAVYTDDAKVLPPDAAMVSGRSAIQQFWEGARSAMGIQAVKLATRDLQVSGDTAYEIGEATLQLRSGSATAKYVVVWKRGANGWRWAVDIWNMNPA